MRVSSFARELDVSGLVALYASAGRDTKVLTFLHPEFLIIRSKSQVSKIDLFILLDRSYMHGAKQKEDDVVANLSYVDEETTITQSNDKELLIDGFPARLVDISWTSHRADVSSYETKVLFIKCDNEQFSAVCQREHWAPDVFIGVCDGCGFGRNDHCVNELVTHGMPRELMQKVALPKWWITDHFKNYDLLDNNGEKEVNELRDGDLVRSLDPLFPVQFRKIGLLSSEWGHYGRRTAFRGANLFKVESVPEHAPTHELSGRRISSL